MSAVTKKVLFLCTGNSCRSQMAEAWAKSIRPAEWEVYSAGIEEHGMNPNVIEVMAESGIDMTSHYSKTLEQLNNLSFDIVVTVCDHASNTCPVLPDETRHVHVPFPDPPKLAQAANDPEEALDCYRQVRDQIRDFVQSAEL